MDPSHYRLEVVSRMGRNEELRSLSPVLLGECCPSHYFEPGSGTMRMPPHFACILLEARMHAKCCRAGDVHADLRSDGPGLLVATPLAGRYPGAAAPCTGRAAFLPTVGHDPRQVLAGRRSRPSSMNRRVAGPRGYRHSPISRCRRPLRRMSQNLLEARFCANASALPPRGCGR